MKAPAPLVRPVARTPVRAAARALRAGLHAALFAGLVAALPARAEPQLLRVRVLEAKKLQTVRVEVHDGALSCDGQPTSLWLAKLHVHGTRVELPDGKLCQSVSAGDVSVAVTAREERRYPGRLTLSAEHGFLRFINRVSIEEYLPSVVASELSGDYEAMKAQAVVARTFALANLHRHEKAGEQDGYDLCDLTHCQLYPGRKGETKDAVAAVAATTGQVLEVKGQLLPVFFHANCGGHTSSARDVFGELGAGMPVAEPSFEGLPACARGAEFKWSWDVPRTQLAKALGVKPAGRAFEALLTDVGGRVMEARAFGHKLTGRDLWSKVAKAFGYSRLKSLKFTVQEVGGTVHFTGYGSGHGVGLCQQGTQALAQHGYGYQKILAHYFAGASLVSH